MSATAVPIAPAQLSLWDAPAPAPAPEPVRQQRPSVNAPPPPDTAHVPVVWSAASIGHRLETAVCAGCGAVLFRPIGRVDGQMMRWAAHRGALTTAGVCRPIPREFWGPRPGRFSL